MTITPGYTKNRTGPMFSFNESVILPVGADYLIVVRWCVIAGFGLRG